MAAIAGRRRRFAARAIDLAVVFFAYAGAYWLAALGYYAVSGCADTGLTTVCGNDDAGGYVAIGVFLAGFVFPLIYESALRRTLGKTVMDLEIAGPNGAPAPRRLRLKRSALTWVPVLILAAATLSTPDDVSAAFGTVLFLYVGVVSGLILAKRPSPWDWLLGTRVVSLRASAQPGPPPRVEVPKPARRRYTRSARRR